MSFDCPQCRSNQTSSFQMIYQGGTSTGTHKSISYGANVGIIGTGGKSSSQSLLAQQVAPPPMPKLTNSDKFFAVCCFLVGTAIFNALISNQIPLFGFVFGLALAGGFLFFKSEQIAVKRNLWKQTIQQWQNSWMCLRCGFTWIR